MSVDFICKQESDTVSVGEKLAAFARKGDVFALFGTLGMGKSVLSRAFIKSLTSAEEVPSPTFTLLQTYNAEDFEIFHFDLYRLKSPEEIFEVFGEIIRLPNIKVMGLMNMAPLIEDREKILELFKDIIKIKEQLEKSYSFEMKEISMGMSNDYDLASLAGSTMIRLGRTLYKEN